MKKSEPTAVRTENAEKTGAAALSKTVRGPEPKTGPDKPKKSVSRSVEETKPAKEKTASAKTKVKSGAAKAKKTSLEPEEKAGPDKAEKSTPKPETEEEPVKMEKPAKPKAAAKSVRKDKSAPEPESRTETAAAEIGPATAQIIDSPLKRMQQEFSERANVIKKEMQNIQNSFLVIGFQLHWIKTNNMYRVLNYKNICDYAEKEYGIKKSTCCNFINIIEHYAERDENGEVIESIADCYRNFSSTQLVAMLGMPEEMQQQVTPDMSVRAIQRLRKGEPEPPPVDTSATITDVKDTSRTLAEKTDTEKPSATEKAKPFVSATETKPQPVKTTETVNTKNENPALAADNTVGTPEREMDAAAEKSKENEPNPENMLAEIDSYTDYRSMAEEIDLMIRHVFSAGNPVRVRILCVQG